MAGTAAASSRLSRGAGDRIHPGLATPERDAAAMIPNAPMTAAVGSRDGWVPALGNRGRIDGAAFTRAGWVGLLVAVTVLQRFGLNFGSYSLNVGLPAIYLLLAVGALSGVLVVSPARLALFAVCGCLALLSALANDSSTSGSSLL